MLNLDALPMSRRQIEFVAGSTARINISSGSIRSSKTISQLLRWLIYTADAPPGGELAIIGKTTNTVASNIFGPLTDPTLFGDLTQYVHYTRGAPTATILGRQARVVGANDARAEERIRGMTCAGALVDEATLMPEEFWTQLLGRMSVPGAKLFATTNPGAPKHWLRKKYILKDGLNLRHWKFTLADNPSLEPEYVASIRSEFTGLFYKRFIEGLWVGAEGQVFDMFDEDVHVVDILPEMQRWVGLGVDVGTVNPTHAVLLGLGVDGNLYAAAEWRYAGGETKRRLTDLEYSERIRAWLRDLRIQGAPRAGVRPEYVVVDPSAASFIQQLHRDGLNPYPADNSVLDGIRQVGSLFVGGSLKVHRSCRQLIEELQTYAWDEKATEKGEDKPLKADDHGPDALRYVVRTTESIWRSRLGLAAA